MDFRLLANKFWPIHRGTRWQWGLFQPYKVWGLWAKCNNLNSGIILSDQETSEPNYGMTSSFQHLVVLPTILPCRWILQDLISSWRKYEVSILTWGSSRNTASPQTVQCQILNPRGQEIEMQDSYDLTSIAHILLAYRCFRASHTPRVATCPITSFCPFHRGPRPILRAFFIRQRTLTSGPKWPP